MPAKQMVVATYDELESAQKVVQGLIEGGFERSKIEVYWRGEGEAYESDSPGETVAGMMGEHRALVTVKAPADRVEPATEIMNRQPPALLGVGADNWREEPWADAIPAPDAYHIIDLKFGDVR